MPSLRPSPIRSSSSTALISPTGLRGGCAQRRHTFRSSTMCRPPCGHGGPVDVVLPTVPHLLERVRRDTVAWPIAPRVVVEPKDKWAAFRQARAALAASGTVTLELALACVPTVVAYKVTLVEELIARALVKARMVGLANIILDEMIMPELLQRQATAKNLADALVAIIGDSPQRRRQCEAFAKLDAMMEIGTAMPSTRAAAAVIALSRKS